MLCSLCKGQGNLFCTQNGIKEWWSCQACGGVGARIMFGPPFIRIHKPPKGIAKKLKQLAMKLEI